MASKKTITTTESSKTNQTTSNSQQEKNQSTSSQQSQSSTQKEVNSTLLEQLLAGLTDTAYTPKTMEELQQMAENLYNPTYSAEVQALKSAQETNNLAYSQQLENMLSAYDKNIGTQDAAFDKSRTAIETGALQRGMGRSSYTMSTLNNNDKARSDALAQMAADYSQNVGQVEARREQMTAQAGSELQRLETDKATNISNTLQQLADQEYERQTAAQNQQNQNYLTAVDMSMGQATTGNQTATTEGSSTTDGTSNTVSKTNSTQTQTTQSGGSGSKKKNGTYTANISNVSSR